MSRETEKAMRDLTKYIDDNRSENATKAEIEKLVQQFMEQQEILDEFDDEPESADDYLDLAEEAGSKKKRLEYLTKALELEPDHLDAAVMMAKEKSKDANEYLEALAALIKKGDKLMTEEGCFQNSMGEFWLVLETRPYMRLRAEYLNTLIDCRMMRAAAAEGRRMLELCENDNLGVRFQLMHIYALLEEEEAAEKLFERYSGNDETLMLLPLAVLYYKLNKPDKSVEYLNRLAESNKDTKKFFTAIKNEKLEEYTESMNPYGYRPFTMDEFIMAITENGFLYLSASEFLFWADTKLKKTTGKAPKRRGKK